MAKFSGIGKNEMRELNEVDRRAARLTGFYSGKVGRAHSTDLSQERLFRSALRTPDPSNLDVPVLKGQYVGRNKAPGPPPLRS